MNLQTPLLEATYIHAEGIGSTTERKLWEEGIFTWRDYLTVGENNLPLTTSQKTKLTPVVEESVQRLEAEDFEWFAKRLQPKHHWRAIPSFGHRLAFVDIETNGGFDANDMTMVGIYDGYKLRQYVRGVDLEKTPEAFEEAAILVTFWGTGFDIPFLKRTFPNLQLNQMHVDLCYVLREVGYRGGLKSIERQLGLQRSNATSGLTGLDAIRLWREYQAGRETSLDTLLEYNGEDVRNMSELLAIAYKKMAHKLVHGK